MLYRKLGPLFIIPLVLTIGCASYTTLRTHPEFKSRRESILAIAITPPVVYYGKKAPSIPIGKTGVYLGTEEIEVKPEMESKVRTNIEDACRKTLQGSRFKLSKFSPSDSSFTADTVLMSALENPLNEVEGIVTGVRRTKAGKNLHMKMESECSSLGSQIKASHLLFIWCSSWETALMDELVPTLLGGAKDYQSEGLYIAMFLVDVSNGEIIWYKDSDQPHNTGIPYHNPYYQGTDSEDVQELAQDLMESLLVVKK